MNGFNIGSRYSGRFAAAVGTLFCLSGRGVERLGRISFRRGRSVGSCPDAGSRRRTAAPAHDKAGNKTSAADKPNWPHLPR